GSLISVGGFVLLGLVYLWFTPSYPGWAKIDADGNMSHLPWWATLGFNNPEGWGVLDMRPAWTCLIGIVLALALNFSTESWTGTESVAVKSLAKNCRTGHATNIIQGIAVGYESAVWSVIIIAVAILGSVLIYSGTSPVFIAYGVAMCGIGM